MGSLRDDDLISHLKVRAIADAASAGVEHREICRQALTEGSSDMSLDVLRGKVRMAPDFDQTPDEIVDAMEGGSV